MNCAAYPEGYGVGAIAVAVVDGGSKGNISPNGNLKYTKKYII